MSVFLCLYLFVFLSICPQLFGLYMVKLAVALTLIGGVAQVSPSGTRIRGESRVQRLLSLSFLLFFRLGFYASTSTVFPSPSNVFFVWFLSLPLRSASGRRSWHRQIPVAPVCVFRRVFFIFISRVVLFESFFRVWRRYAAKISSRAVMTTGIGTTSAGLTVSVVKVRNSEGLFFVCSPV